MKRIEDRGTDVEGAIKELFDADLPVCMLCKGPAIYGGMFFPKNPEAYGARPGEEIVFRVGLCQDHPPNEAVLDVVEKTILSTLKLN